MTKKQYNKLLSASEDKTAVAFAFDQVRKGYYQNLNVKKYLIDDYLKKVVNFIDKLRKDKPIFDDFIAQVKSFNKEKIPSWFSREYFRYKINKYATGYLKIKPFIKGRKILDFGCGSGLFSVLLERYGYSVYAVDRINSVDKKNAKKINFTLLKKYKVLPFKDNYFDTAIVKWVFHHIDKEDQSVIVKEIRRVASRIIIEEDVYGPFLKDKNYYFLMKTQKDFRVFNHLKNSTQLNWLTIHDFIANAISQRAIEMNFPFQFKTEKQWLYFIKKNQLKIVKRRLLGFPDNKLHRCCQSILICDS